MATERREAEGRPTEAPGRDPLPPAAAPEAPGADPQTPDPSSPEASPREEAPPPRSTGGRPWHPVLVFALIVVLVGAFLRLLHLGVPLLYPPVLAGPFSLETAEEAEEIVGFEPLMPFYRPEVLGTAPVNVTARRAPQPQLTVFWQGERFLVLTQRRGGPPPFARAESRPLPDHPEAQMWREGRTWRVVLPYRGLWIEIRTDLPEEDLHRLIETLRPYTELR